LIQSQHERVFPWGTWVINITGSFAFGLLTGLGQSHGIDARLLASLGTGFLGSYTTFSTFTWESLRLVEDGSCAASVLNVAGSLAAGACAAAGGLLLGSTG